MKRMKTLLLLVPVLLLFACGEDPVLPNSYIPGAALPTGNLTLHSPD